MGLAPPRVADHDDVPPILDELAGGQFIQESWGEGGVELEQVELVQGLLERKAAALRCRQS